MVSFGHLFGPFWDHFPSHALPNGAQSAKKDPFRKHQKNYQILGAKMTPKMTSKTVEHYLSLGVLDRFRSPFGSRPAPDPHFGHFWVLFWNRFDYFQTCFQLEIQTL
jgi:hypothetical protein